MSAHRSWFFPGALTVPSRRPATPRGLGKAGRDLWLRIVRDLPAGWELDARELRALEQGCRCADDAAALEDAVAKSGRLVSGSKGQPRAHPALDVLVRLRTLEAALLRQLELEPPAVKSPAQSRAGKAAAARWTARRKQGAVA